MKKLVFSLIATVFIGVSSISAQASLKNFSKIGGLGFGKISSYAGPCVDGPGTCSGDIIKDDSLTFEVGISKVSETEVSYAFSKRFYDENIQYLKNGLYIGMPFSLPKVLTEALGLRGEFVVSKGNYPVVEKEGYYFVSVLRVK